MGVSSALFTIVTVGPTAGNTDILGMHKYWCAKFCSNEFLQNFFQQYNTSILKAGRCCLHSWSLVLLFSCSMFSGACCEIRTAAVVELSTFCRHRPVLTYASDRSSKQPPTVCNLHTSYATGLCSKAWLTQFVL